MGDDVFILKINELVSLVNTYPEINEQGLKETDFPDIQILSLHNHLGNIKQYLSGVTIAVNATDQFLMIKNAEKELTDVRNDLYTLHHKDVINDKMYSRLSESVSELEQELSAGSDPDYL